MATNGKQNGANGDAFMMHDPLDDIDGMSSSADDILEGEFLPASPHPVERPEPDEVVDLQQEEVAQVEEVFKPEEVVSMERPAKMQEPVVNGAGKAVSLGTSLTIRDVAELHDQLLAALDNGSGTLDLLAEELEQIDGAGLQLLVAVLQEARQRGTDLRWIGVTDVMRQAAAGMGMERMFDW
jgi:anti-anti-sigma regulatory factor